MAKTPSKPPPPPADTQGQQAAARALLWLGAAFGAAFVLGGAWLFSLAFTDQALLPTRAGIGFVLMGFGSVSCWAGIYAAAHSRLEAGKLRFDAQARELFSSEAFIRFLKACGHGAGITLLVVSWMAVYYPQGIVLR